MKGKVKKFFGNPKVIKKIDYLIFIIAVIGFILILGKAIYPLMFQGTYPINIDWIVLIMMTSLIFLYGLKMLGGKASSAGFQLLLMAIVIVMLAMFIGVFKIMAQ